MNYVFKRYSGNDCEFREMFTVTCVVKPERDPILDVGRWRMRMRMSIVGEESPVPAEQSLDLDDVYVLLGHRRGMLRGCVALSTLVLLSLHR